MNVLDQIDLEVLLQTPTTRNEEILVEHIKLLEVEIKES
jgi:hypothetical protein